MDTDGKMENPDQRIAEDCGSYVGKTTEIFTSLLTSVINLYMFLPLLYRLSPPIFPVEGWLCYASATFPDSDRGTTGTSITSGDQF